VGGAARGGARTAGEENPNDDSMILMSSQ